MRGLYVVTDPDLCRGQLLSMVWEALVNGARVVQYRNKQAPPEQCEADIRRLLALCRAHRAPLIVNDHLDLAIRTGADGLHVGQDTPNLEQVRARLGPQRILGVTCHDSLDLADHATRCGADYVSMGAVFPSDTKPAARRVTLDQLATACHTLTTPVVAIGGIQRDNAAQVAAQGCRCVAVAGGVFRDGNVGENARELSRMFPPI